MILVHRAVAWSAKKEHDKAVKDYEEIIRLEPKSRYAFIRGHLAARQAGNEAKAKRFLNDAAGKLDKTAWPYPLVKFLRGEMDEAALLKQAGDNDKQTEARCYLGLDYALKGRKKEALTHFRWVKEHGNSNFNFVEYTIAMNELERLERPKEKPKR